MQQHHRIYIAGHTGMVGSALYRLLQSQGYSKLIVRTHRELDLMDQRAVFTFFEKEKPQYVFLAAAKVGGIVANDTYPAEFIYNNLQIQANVIHAAWKAGVERLLFLGSSCIYPRDCPQPINESYFMTGPLEKTNRPYATAKISGIELCWSYNRQYGCRFVAAMPTNLYGPGDHYDPDHSHVIPALLYKFHEAKRHQQPSVTVWGSGNPRREFLYCEDAANACAHVMNLPEVLYASLLNDREPPIINVGVGEDLTVGELAHKIARVVEYDGDIVWDKNKPDGTPRKLLDVSRIRELGWSPKMSLERGLQLTYQSFISNYEKAPICR